MAKDFYEEDNSLNIFSNEEVVFPAFDDYDFDDLFSLLVGYVLEDKFNDEYLDSLKPLSELLTINDYHNFYKLIVKSPDRNSYFDSLFALLKYNEEQISNKSIKSFIEKIEDNNGFFDYNTSKANILKRPFITDTKFGINILKSYIEILDYYRMYKYKIVDDIYDNIDDIKYELGNNKYLKILLTYKNIKKDIYLLYRSNYYFNEGVNELYSEYKTIKKNKKQFNDSMIDNNYGNNVTSLNCHVRNLLISLYIDIKLKYNTNEFYILSSIIEDNLVLKPKNEYEKKLNEIKEYKNYLYLLLVTDLYLIYKAHDNIQNDLKCDIISLVEESKPSKFMNNYILDYLLPEYMKFIGDENIIKYAYQKGIDEGYIVNVSNVNPFMKIEIEQYKNEQRQCR